MERLQGSLRDVLDGYLAKSRQPPLEQALQWLLDTARGLAECHEANVVHSDVKAANVLVDAQRRAKIADLGAGRVTRALSATASLVGSTAGGNARGSMLWLSSEMMDDQTLQPSKASDVYAWACTAFEILSVRRRGAALKRASSGAPFSLSLVRAHQPTPNSCAIACPPPRFRSAACRTTARTGSSR